MIIFWLRKFAPAFKQGIYGKNCTTEERKAIVHVRTVQLDAVQKP